MKTVEAQEALEQLILIYRFLEEKRLFEKFYGHQYPSDLEKENIPLYRLIQSPQGIKIVKNSIIELDEIISGEKISNKEFERLMAEFDPSDSYRKYNMKGLGDVVRLDLEWLIKIMGTQ